MSLSPFNDEEPKTAPIVSGRVAVVAAQPLSSKAEVDEVMTKATAAEAAIVKPAHDTFWGGYSGHFLDPDGHLWEIVWNPRWSETTD